MPYIPSGDRLELNPLSVGRRQPHTSGELNYVITTLLLQYALNRGIDYDCLNTLIGVLDSVKAEIQRRCVTPYEEKAKDKNGDVCVFQDFDEMLGR